MHRLVVGPGVVLAACALFSQLARATEIEAVLAGPIFKQVYACTEHWQGNLKGLGDELGTDCFIEHLVEEEGRTWLRPYSGRGTRNDDWFGWGQDVLSPCACEIVEAKENPTVNEPGVVGTPPASYLVLQRADGVSFLLAHVASVRVNAGDRVAMGQVIAVVGNNGYARHPHVHVGAWRDGAPLQIRFDQAAMGKLLEH